MTITIISPKPPLNLFEVSRVALTDAWQTVYEVPYYQIPATGTMAAITVGAAAILTGVAIVNTGTTTISVSVKIKPTSTTEFLILNEAQVPPNDFMQVALEKQVLKSGELMQIKLNTSQTGSAHVSFILNQRETYDVVTA